MRWRNARRSEPIGETQTRAGTPAISRQRQRVPRALSRPLCLPSQLNYFRSVHSLGAVGGLVSSAGIVSRGWAAIQSSASSLEVNFPKWCTAPFGHAICTRQISPSRTGNKTVHCVAINQSMLPLDETDKLFGQAAPMPSSPGRLPHVEEQ